MMQSKSLHLSAFVIVAAAVLGIAGVDLILPAVPGLPDRLGGTTAAAQYVIAAYSLGTAVGLLAFGELGARYDRIRLLGISLLLFAAVSLTAASSTTMEVLIGWRFFQGALGAAAAVFAPGLVRSIYGDDHAPKVMGWLGSAESLAPALAPMFGLFLLKLGDWRLPFWIMSVSALAWSVASVILLRRYAGCGGSRQGSYLTLLRNRGFLRFGLSQSLSLGSILIFVFGAPVVFTESMKLSIEAFITMQVLGISAFICGTIASHYMSGVLGARRVIWIGTSIIPLTFALIFLTTVAARADTAVILPLFALNGFGFGLRGPIGFHQAIVASEGDDGRAAALVGLMVLITAAAGTAVMAPYLHYGLLALSGLAAAVGAAGLAALLIGRDVSSALR